jgi:hypothetical protein
MANLKELAAQYFNQFSFDSGWAKPEPQYLEPFREEDIAFTRRYLSILGD